MGQEIHCRRCGKPIEPWDERRRCPACSSEFHNACILKRAKCLVCDWRGVPFSGPGEHPAYGGKDIRPGEQAVCAKCRRCSLTAVTIGGAPLCSSCAGKVLFSGAKVEIDGRVSGVLKSAE